MLDEQLRAGFEQRRGVSERTAVYWFFDASGELIYVGVAKNTVQRWSQHSKTSGWWRQVARCGLDHGNRAPDRREAGDYSSRACLVGDRATVQCRAGDDLDGIVANGRLLQMYLRESCLTTRPARRVRTTCPDR